MTDEMTLARALNAVAARVRADLAEFLTEYVFEVWDRYPEIGEHDWQSVVARVVKPADPPSAEEYAAGYEFLAKRAEGVEP